MRVNSNGLSSTEISFILYARLLKNVGIGEENDINARWLYTPIIIKESDMIGRLVQQYPYLGKRQKIVNCAKFRKYILPLRKPNNVSGRSRFPISKRLKNEIMDIGSKSY